MFSPKIGFTGKDGGTFSFSGGSGVAIIDSAVGSAVTTGIGELVSVSVGNNVGKGVFVARGVLVDTGVVIETILDAPNCVWGVQVAGIES